MLDDFLTKHGPIERMQCVVTDPNGVARGKWLPGASLAKLFEAGVNLPLSIHALDVWGTEVHETGLHIASGDRDGVFRPVPHTLSPIRDGEAQVLLETFTTDGAPFDGCTRQALARVVERLGARGMNATAAFELEFHLLEADGGVAEASGLREAQRMYDMDALDRHRTTLDRIARLAEAAEVPADTVVKEAAPGQYEVNLVHRADDPLRSADDAILLRRIVRSAAAQAGLRATFMPKPFADEAGNGMHVHCSLTRDGPVFADDDALTHAACGLVETMAEATLAFANSFNGFRRLAPGSYAPTHAAWGRNNRSVAVRVPTGAPRLEHRVAGADANPYLVLALVLEGMMHGLDAGRTIAEAEGDTYEHPAGAALPARMEDSIALWDGSDFVARAVGETLRANLAHIKRAEHARMSAQISDFERATYL